MTHFKLLIVFLMIGMAANAQVAKTSLVINQQSGGQAIFALAESPVITVVGENLNVKSTQTEISIPISNVKNYEIKDVDGIASAQMSEQTPKLVNGHVLFSNIKEGEQVAVYATDGRLIKSYKANSNGQVDAYLGELPHGTYIVKSPSTAIKIINK